MKKFSDHAKWTRDMTGYHKLTEKKKQENDEEGNSFIKYTIIFLIIEYIIINNTYIMKVSLK